MNTYKIETSREDDGMWIAQLDGETLKSFIIHGDTEEQAIYNVLALYFTMRELS